MSIGKWSKFGIGLAVIVVVTGLGFWVQHRRQENHFRAELDGMSIIRNAVDDYYWVYGKLPAAEEVHPWIDKRGLKSNSLVELESLSFENDRGLTIAHMALNIDGKLIHDGTSSVELVKCGTPGKSLTVWLADDSFVTRNSEGGCPVGSNSSA